MLYFHVYHSVISVTWRALWRQRSASLGLASCVYKWVHASNKFHSAQLCRSREVGDNSNSRMVISEYSGRFWIKVDDQFSHRFPALCLLCTCSVTPLTTALTHLPMTHWCRGCWLFPLLTLQGSCFLCSSSTDAAWLWSLCLRVSNENSSTSLLPVSMCLFLEAGPGDLHHTYFFHTLPVPQIITTTESSHFPPSCKSIYAISHLGIIECTVLLSTLFRVSLNVCYIGFPAHGHLYIIYSQSRGCLLIDS